MWDKERTRFKNTQLSFVQIYLTRLLHTDMFGCQANQVESFCLRRMLACDYLGILKSLFTQKSQYSSYVVCKLSLEMKVGWVLILKVTCQYTHFSISSLTELLGKNREPCIDHNTKFYQNDCELYPSASIYTWQN